jgi:hypothetical protein
MTRPHPLTRRLVAAALLGAGILLAAFSAGCASTDSDIPWNAPQPWEGSPTIPGLPTE